MSVQPLAPFEPAAAPAFVRAELMFARRGAQKPYTYAYEPPAGAAESNAVFEPEAVQVHNARPFAGDLSLDREGVALVRSRSAVRDFWDEAQTLALGHP